MTEPLKQTAVARVELPVAKTIELSTTSGMLVKDVGQAMDVAKLMSISGTAVPAHIRNNAGTCLAVAIQAWEWSMNPFAVANKSYVVNDRLAYESALYNAVVTRRAPIAGRLRIAYTGEGPTRRCTISATLRPDAGGGEVDYQSPKFGEINPKNSPLWKNDPDQQLFYFSVRAFVRRHFPDVMMGVYTVDELEDAAENDLQPTPRREVVSVDIESVLGKATEETTQPGGTAETAPQPREKAHVEGLDDDAPAPDQSEDTPPAAADEPKTEATDLPTQIRSAWAKRLQELKGFEPHPDQVEDQIENYCTKFWAKMSFADVIAKKPTWLPKLLGFIVDGKIPKERFDYNIQAMPDASATTSTEDAEPTRPAKRK